MKKMEKSNDLKIVFMFIYLINNLFVLGIILVGFVIGGDLKDFLLYVKEKLKDMKKFGVVIDLNMEVLF